MCTIKDNNNNKLGPAIAKLNSYGNEGVSCGRLQPAWCHNNQNHRLSNWGYAAPFLATRGDCGRNYDEEDNCRRAEIGVRAKARSKLWRKKESFIRIQMENMDKQN